MEGCRLDWTGTPTHRTPQDEASGWFQWSRRPIHRALHQAQSILHESHPLIAIPIATLIACTSCDVYRSAAAAVATAGHNRTKCFCRTRMAKEEEESIQGEAGKEDDPSGANRDTERDAAREMGPSV